MNEQTIVLGIDLGTTNTVVSFIEKNQLEILKLHNQEIIPSVLFFETSDRIIFGAKALKKEKLYPQSAIKLFKRRLKADAENFTVMVHKKNAETKTETASLYIVDTNVFIDDPEILSRFEQNDKIVVTTKVIDELSYRRTKLETEWQAEVAIKNIEENKSRLIFESSDSSLLPEDFDTRLPDNLILSIALKLHEKNPILLTSDKEFQLKCSTQNIKFLSCEDFKNKAAQQYHNHIDSIEVSGENACTRFLEFIRSESEKKIGLGSISNAVITVPANFNNAEIEAIKRAGEKAGFVNISIVKEPTAAAIAYGFDVEENKKILVYDFGGGTFDVSIIESRNNVFEVLTTGGDSELGGEDLTRALIDEVYDQLYEKLDLDMYSLKDSGLEQDEYRHNLREISTAAELTKVHLSAFEEDTIDISLYVGDGEEQSLNLPISRVDFENLVRDKIKKTLDILDNTFMATDFKVDDIDIVVLAGGSSLMPIIQDRIEKYFGRVPNSEKDTATVISQGAAIVANSEWGRPEDGIKKKIQYFENTVADFGVKIKGKLFDCLIEKRTELPVRVEKEYTPATNNQESLRIEVYSRGDEYLNSKRVFDKGVEYIDEILISNLPPMDIDQTSIKVFFELTKEDILHVDVEIYDISRDNELINTKNLEITKSSRFH